MPQPVVSFEIYDHEILKKQDYVVSKRDHLDTKLARLWLISYILSSSHSLTDQFPLIVYISLNGFIYLVTSPASFNFGHLTWHVDKFKFRVGPNCYGPKWPVSLR